MGMIYFDIFFNFLKEKYRLNLYFYCHIFKFSKNRNENIRNDVLFWKAHTNENVILSDDRRFLKTSEEQHIVENKIL